MSCPVLALDGPGGSGKGTVARLLAARLGWHYLNSGALYRALGLLAQQRGIGLDDANSLAGLARELPVEFAGGGDGDVVQIEGRDVSTELVTESVGEAASRVASIPAVREALLARQRRFAEPPGLVAEGRDMGTVVFPEAVLKVFLTASPEERARRRHKQLKEKGIDVSLPALSKDIAERDSRDASRSVAPLKPAGDARILDSTNLSPAEVVARIEHWLKAADVSCGRP